MLSIVLLSASVAFAATDDNTTIGEVDNEIAIDEDVLSVESDEEVALEESTPLAGENNVVTNSTFYNFFDSSGKLLDNVTSDELVFEGDFAGVGVDGMIFEKAIKLTGNNASFSGITFQLYANNIVVDNFNLVQDCYFSIVDVSNVTITNTKINYTAIEGYNAYAFFIYGADNLKLLNNTILYVGTSNATVYNDAIRAIKSQGLVISGNTINTTSPAGGRSAIYLEECANPVLTDNLVVFEYNDVIGWGSTDVVYLGAGSDNALISGNTIMALGANYVYAIKICTDNFTIEDNLIGVASDVNYACGIEIDDGASGVVRNNTVEVVSPCAVYGIYSSMWYPANPLIVDYINNTISGKSFFSCGIELGGAKENVIGNAINLEGNYTIGIALYKYGQDTIYTTIRDNEIKAMATNVGDPNSVYDAVGIEAAGIKITAGNITVTDNHIHSTAGGIYASCAGIDLINNTIDVEAVDFVDNYAIAGIDVESMLVAQNKILFTGKNNGTVSSNAVLMSNVEDLSITDNAIYATLTAGGGSAIYLDACPDSFIYNNTVYLYCNGVVGWGSTDIVYVGVGSDGAILRGNKIDALGANYVYGIKTYAKDFTIDNNTLGIVSNVDYACGIDCEGGATGVVTNNNIYAIGVGSAYPIYSGMYGGMGNLDVDYIGNQIYGLAYYVVAVELGGANENVINNTIIAKGNYTIGVGTYSLSNTISENVIRVFGNSVGDQSVWDEMGLVTTGIKVIHNPDVLISDNYIDAANADYAIDLGNTNSTITDNFVAAKKSIGTNAIINAGSGAVIVNVTPSLKAILSAVSLYTVYDSGDVYYVVAMDENGDPIVNETIQLSVNNQYFEVKTDNNGVAPFYLELPVGNYKTSISFFGSKVYGPKAINGYIAVEPRVAEFDVASSSTVLLTAINSGSYFKITLKDDRGVALANETVTVTFNGKTANYTTDESGVINYKLVANAIGTQTLTMLFNNVNYVGTTADSTITIVKEATKVTAAKKVFKAKTKVKKYLVVLKDSKGKGIKNAKLLLKMKGKKCVATTNSKGKAVFKITKFAKKGKYAAAITFAGNKLYKASKVKVVIIIK